MKHEAMRIVDIAHAILSGYFPFLFGLRTYVLFLSFFRGRENSGSYGFLDSNYSY